MIIGKKFMSRLIEKYVLFPGYKTLISKEFTRRKDGGRKEKKLLAGYVASLQSPQDSQHALGLCEQHPSLQTSQYCAAICRFKNSLDIISRNAFMVLLNK